MTIRCKLHKLIEGLQADPENGPLIENLQAWPMFLFSAETSDILLKSKAANASIVALSEAGMVHLPYPQMTVQMPGSLQVNDDSDKYPVTWFVSLQEKSDGSFHAWCCAYHPSAILASRKHAHIQILDGEGYHVEAEEETDAYISSAGLTMAVLMTHISGLDREVVEAPAKLNKKRERSGKPGIARYSYVHVGRVYDSSGVAYERSGAGRLMPIHMRAGHVRQQAYGEGRALRRPIWIPPVLVNFKPNDEGRPMVEKRVVL